MIEIQQLKLPPNHKEADLIQAAAKQLHCKVEDIESYQIIKKSIDARKKSKIQYSYTLHVNVKQEKKILKRNQNKNITKATVIKYVFPPQGEDPLYKRPIIIGSGPAGLFCALTLAKHGYKPLLLERGEDVDCRTSSVEEFWKTGKLKEASNVQFGEGGAGTFSDGKLNTLVKDQKGRNKEVLKTFVEFGAPEEILYLNKPHIGTDILRDVVKGIRKEMVRLGGEVRFSSHVTDIIVEHGAVSGVVINQKEKIKTDIVVLAIGHSARDTFSMLHEKNLEMVAKSFAVGVRIEHPQEMINQAQYGVACPVDLPTAEYKVSKQLENGRGVYSFCMCPGGYVVNASSEPERLAVNGMSYHNRDSKNANSAVIVTISPKDYGGEGPLAGVEFQRQLEEKAYQLGEGKIPVQLFKDFCLNKESLAFKEITPCMKGEYKLTNLRSILPSFISQSLEDGIHEIGKSLKGFDREDALLSGVESRTSSPLRMTRDSFYESNIKGIYPCGEGAGYAGGITSAAMDGIKIAESIGKKFKPSYF